mmetsp:Transcript_31437/g.35921  ORF Transcript_31437/g.35921 Transcript_31437/m.35921 type:complete len:90 (-) Transcript_31437:235-504(-)
MQRLNPKLDQQQQAAKYGIDSKDIDRYFENEEQKNSSAKDMLKRQIQTSTVNYSKKLFSEWVTDAYTFCIDKCIYDNHLESGAAKTLEK